MGTCICKAMPWLIPAICALLPTLGSCDRPTYIGLGHDYLWFRTQGPSDHAPRVNLVHKSDSGYELVASGADPVESIVVRDKSLVVFRAAQDGERARGLCAFKPGYGVRRVMATDAFDVYKVERTNNGIHTVGFQNGVERTFTWEAIESRFADTK